jgi:hypothetical protein
MLILLAQEVSIKVKMHRKKRKSLKGDEHEKIAGQLS